MSVIVSARIEKRRAPKVEKFNTRRWEEVKFDTAGRVTQQGRILGVGEFSERGSSLS